MINIKLKLIIMFIILIFLLIIIKTQPKNNFILDYGARHKILIVRILGNNLNYIHGTNQTYDNLKFILENEYDFENCDKLWILNRIVDKKKEQQYIDILNKYNKKYIVINFSEIELQKLKIKYPVNFKKIKNKYDLISELYYYIKYICNINGARNLAIKYGKKNDYLYTFPLDGSCIFSNKQVLQINKYIYNNFKRKAVIVLPMLRLKEHRFIEYLYDKKKFISDSKYEPQLGIHYKSNILFDENVIYPLNDKALLIYNLNIEGIWKKDTGMNNIYKDKKWKINLIKLYNLIEPNLDNHYVNNYIYIPYASVYRLPYEKKKLSIQPQLGIQSDVSIEQRFKGMYYFFKNILQ